MGGDPTFAALSRKLAFGADCPAVGAGRIATVQSLSGTGEQEGCATFVQAHLSKQHAVRGLRFIGCHACYEMCLCEVWVWDALHTAHTRRRPACRGRVPEAAPCSAHHLPA